MLTMRQTSQVVPLRTRLANPSSMRCDTGALPRLFYLFRSIEFLMKSQHQIVLGLSVVLLFWLTASFPAWATSQQDIEVALKTLPLLTDKIKGPATAAIVYDPASPESKTDAAKIKSFFDNGLEAPDGLKISANLVSTTSLSELSKARIVFLAQGLPESDYRIVNSASDGSLTIGLGRDCAQLGQCVLGVTSEPQVEVYYNAAAAERANVHFAATFIILVKQVGE